MKLVSNTIFHSAYSWPELQQDVAAFSTADVNRFLKEVNLILKGKVRVLILIIFHCLTTNITKRGIKGAKYLIVKIFTASLDLVKQKNKIILHLVNRYVLGGCNKGTGGYEAKT